MEEVNSTDILSQNYLYGVKITMQNIEKIATKRLIARKITENDFELLNQMHLNPKIMATLGGLRTEQETRSNLEWNLNQWRDNGFGLWLWFDKDTHNFVGRAGLRVVNATGKDEVEVGYALVPEYWNKGYATEIAKACIQIAFEKLHLNKLICYALVTNKPSRRVMEKVGFHYTKDIVQANESLVVYELFADYFWQKVITFQPLTKKHLKLLITWFDKSHVKEWWSDALAPEQIKEKYGTRIGDKIVQPFIVYLREIPIGFIQYYYADKVGDDWWPDATPGIVGIDQFIGDENYINKGYGTQLIGQFVKKLFNDSAITKIITDVDPKNQRAIRCYQKVGFKIVKEIDTPEGCAILMEILR